MKQCKVKNCGRNHRSLGFCNRHYLAFRKYGTTEKDITKDKRYKHNMAHSDIYAVWCSIKARCDNPKSKSYKDYGGRGISYPKSWKRFECFYRDIGAGYKKGLTINRIDNSKGYSKNNCRWVDMKIQSNNRKNSLLVELNGKILTLSQYCQKLNLNYNTIYYRIKNSKNTIFNPKNN